MNFKGAASTGSIAPLQSSDESVSPQSIKLRLSQFLMIGAIGFVVDAGLLLFLHERMAINVYLSRCVSFPLAMTTTWLLNRLFTFSDSRSPGRGREWGRYAVVNSIGALLNLGIFFVLVTFVALLQDAVLLPLAIAAAVALVFNFLGSRFFVYTGPA
jgi:putative flippase GtrA